MLEFNNCKMRSQKIGTPKTSQTFFRKDLKKKLVDSELDPNINLRSVKDYRKPAFRILKKIGAIISILMGLFFILSHPLIIKGYFGEESSYLVQFLKSFPHLMIIFFVYLHTSHYFLTAFKYN